MREKTRRIRAIAPLLPSGMQFNELAQSTLAAGKDENGEGDTPWFRTAPVLPGGLQTDGEGGCFHDAPSSTWVASVRLTRQFNQAIAGHFDRECLVAAMVD